MNVCRKRCRAEEEGARCLPQEVIHRIMSHLNAKEKAQSCVLSKDWLSACLTYPRLDFQYRYFDQRCQGHNHRCCPSSEQDQQNFKKHIGRVMAYLKGTPCDIIITEMIIDSRYMWCFEGDGGSTDDWNSFIDEQVKIAIQKGVKVVRLFGRFDSVVPESILAAESLTDLFISEVRFQKGTLFMCCNIQCLELRSVYIDGGIFSGLIRSCPLIADLIIANCRGLDSIRVINLPKLKKLGIYRFGCCEITVDAPSVESMDLMLLEQVRLDLQPSKSLKHLSLQNVTIRDAFFDNLMNKFPNLDFLRVSSCDGLERINFRSHSLRHMYIRLPFRSPVRSPIEVDVEAPNMNRIECGDYITVLNNLCFRGVSADAHATVRLFGTFPQLDAKWFPQWKEFLLTSRPSKVSMDLHYLGVEITLPSCAKNPVEVQELELNPSFQSPPKRESCSSVLHGFLLACHPKTIVLRVTVPELTSTMALVLYHELITERKEKDSFKQSPRTVKNWQRDVEKAEAEIYDKTGKMSCLELKDLDNLVISSKIVFKLQWKMEDANSSSS